MERRYLAATIAMAATFAIFSHAFSSGLVTKLHDPRATLVSEARCAAQTLRTRLLDKVNHSLGTSNGEEAQLRVEFNLPAPMLAAAPAVPAVPAVAPVAPVPPVAAQLACPSQRLLARTSRNYERAQALAMKMQSKALATQAKLMAVEARLTSQTMQREMRRAALAEVRANIAQAKSHPCNGARTVHVAASDDDDINIDVNLDQLGSQIEEQVSRTLRSTSRTF